MNNTIFLFIIIFGFIIIIFVKMFIYPQSDIFFSDAYNQSENSIILKICFFIFRLEKFKLINKLPTYAHDYFKGDKFSVKYYLAILKDYNSRYSNKNAANFVLKNLIKLDNKERLKVMDFLFFSLSQNGIIDKKELKLLEKYFILMKFNKKTKDFFFSKYNQYIFEEKQEKKKDAICNTYISEKEKALSILACNLSSTPNEIKRNYRKLVKKYHPDMQINKTEKIREEYKNKFLEVQNAFDYLTSIYKM